MTTATTGPTATPFPSGAIHCCRGRGVAVVGNDIDTDRIIPARFLKCVTFDGLAEGAFADDRRELAGAHPFDRREHRGARVLVVNRNFGCGSSREHAPQALMRWGIRAVVGESFAEIFFGNCLALGIPCLGAEPGAVAELQSAIQAEPSLEFELDVRERRLRLLVATPAAAAARLRSSWPLELAEGPHRMLTTGLWDGTSQLLAHAAGLEATVERLPYLNGFTPVEPA